MRASARCGIPTLWYSFHNLKYFQEILSNRKFTASALFFFSIFFWSEIFLILDNDIFIEMIVWNFSARPMSFANFLFRLIISKNLFSVVEMILDWWNIFAWISSSWSLDRCCAFNRHCCKMDFDAFNLIIFNFSNASKYKDSRRSMQSFLFKFQRLSHYP